MICDFFTQIGETIADKSIGKPLPAIRVEEPTVKMAFSINISPFVGREVCLKTCKLECLATQKLLREIENFRNYFPAQNLCILVYAMMPCIITCSYGSFTMAQS